MSAVLLTRLKIADLAAWTALDAGRRLLPPGLTLGRLVREELYLFVPETGRAADAFEGPLSLAIESSNFFVNPNKEQYRFLTAKGRGDALAAPEGAWGILARARDESRDEGLLRRLLSEHPLEGLGAIHRARIWWLWTNGPGEGTAVETIDEALGPVVTRRRGLLVNPHSEAALRVEGGISWSVVERFLTLPPPAIGAAA